MCLRKAGGEIRRSSTGDEVAVGIMPERQLDEAGGCAGTWQALRKLVSSALAGLVFILVKNHVDRTSGPIAELLEPWNALKAGGGRRLRWPGCRG